MPPKMGSGTGSDIAQYACQFVGESLCTGRNQPDKRGGLFRVHPVCLQGIWLQPSQKLVIPEKRGQGGFLEEAQPGDLICYAGHVAIYLGNGRIVHASSVKTGIKYGYATYKPILSVRRIVN